jgi:hypothetical protein
MPKLTGKQGKVERISLPSFEGSEDPAWVDIYTTLELTDLLAFQEANRGREQTTIALVKVIADWNFTKEDGTKEEINAENVGKMVAEDLNILYDKLNVIADKVLDAKKKSSTSKSTKKSD